MSLNLARRRACVSRNWLRLFLTCIFAAIAALFCGAAAAEQSRRFVLTWQAPAGCPTEAQVIREIDELVANSAPAGNITIAASASIAGENDGFTLTLMVRDVEGSHGRRLEAPTCDELGHAAALIVALAIDPALLANQSIPSGTSTFTPPARPFAEPNSTQLPNASPPSIPMAQRAESPTTFSVPPRHIAAEPLFWRVGLSAFAAYHTLPGINLGTGLFGAIQARSLRIELSASSLSANLKSGANRAATFELDRIAPRLCWFVTETTWAAGPCAGVELGRLSGSGYGVTNAQQAKAFWLGSSFGALLELRIASSSVVGIFADAEVPWVPNQFNLNSIDVFKTGISGRFGISLAAGWH